MRESMYQLLLINMINGMFDNVYRSLEYSFHSILDQDKLQKLFYFCNIASQIIAILHHISVSGLFDLCARRDFGMLFSCLNNLFMHCSRNIVLKRHFSM